MVDYESAVVSSRPHAGDADLALRDESAAVKLLVRSDRVQFDGLRFGRSMRLGDALVAATRPDEWLLLGDAAAVNDAAATIDTEGFTSVIPFTHGRSLFRLTGEAAVELLAKECNLDWSDPMMPDGAVVSAAVASVTCDVIRADVDDAPSYLLVSDRSFGQYLFDALLDAGEEFGIGVLPTG